MQTWYMGKIQTNPAETVRKIDSTIKLERVCFYPLKKLDRKYLWGIVPEDPKAHIVRLYLLAGREDSVAPPRPAYREASPEKFPGGFAWLGVEAVPLAP